MTKVIWNSPVTERENRGQGGGVQMVKRLELYEVVAVDRATGRKQAASQTAPIEGKNKAEEQVRFAERNNRNPNLHYRIEPWTRVEENEEELTPNSLITHNFKACRAWR